MKGTRALLVVTIPLRVRLQIHVRRQGHVRRRISAPDEFLGKCERIAGILQSRLCAVGITCRRPRLCKLLRDRRLLKLKDGPSLPLAGDHRWDRHICILNVREGSRFPCDECLVSCEEQD